MARAYQWFTVRADVGGIDDGDTESVDLLAGGAVAGATVMRAVVYLFAAGTLDLSPQFVGAVLVGLQVAAASPTTPFDSPELETTDWLWLGADQMLSGTESPTTVVKTMSSGFQTGIQTRASRVLTTGETVWLSAGLESGFAGGTWNLYFISRVLCLMPDT